MTGAAMSFGSFSKGAGGWQIGQQVGALTDDQARALQPLAPTQLSSTTAVPTYPSREERTRLVRRYAWIPAPWDDHQRVFLASVPAGADATGRQGNVFTYIHLPDAAEPASFDVVDALYSPDIPTPFGSRETDAAQIPEQLRTPGPVRDLVGFFLDGWDDAAGTPLPEPFSTIPNTTTGQRRINARYIAHLIAEGKTVVLATPIHEAVLWVAAVTEELTQAAFSFSTFERVNTVVDATNRGAQLVCIPPQDVIRARLDLDQVEVLLSTEDYPAVESVVDKLPVATPTDPVLVDATPISNPFEETEAPRTEVEFPADTAWKDIQSYLKREDTPKYFTPGITVKPGPRDRIFLAEATPEQWAQVLQGQGDSFTVSRILALLLFPPTTAYGRQSRVKVLAAEALHPGCSEAVTRFEWLFDFTAEQWDSLKREAVHELQDYPHLPQPGNPYSPVHDLVTQIVEEHAAYQGRRDELASISRKWTGPSTSQSAGRN